MTRADPPSTRPGDPCPGCGWAGHGEPAPAAEPPFAASAACWACFGEVLAREFSDPTYYWPAHPLTVATYAVQHPGAPSPQAAQAIGWQLLALHAALEDEAPATEVRARLTRTASRRADLPWLDPPLARGTLTAADVLDARSGPAHADLVRRWAADVWAAWAPHHATIRAWAAPVVD